MISGSDFVFLCNPFEPCTGTICAHCGYADSLSQFRWADTGEALNDYRRRLRHAASFGVKLWAFVLSPLLGAIAGGVALYLFYPEASPALLMSAVLGGAFIMWIIIGPKILRLFGPGGYYRIQ